MNLINEFLERINKLIESNNYELRKNNSKIEQGDNSNDKRIISEVLSNIDNVSLIGANIEIIRKYCTNSDITLLNAFLKQYNMLKDGIKERMYTYNKDKIENAINRAYSKIKVIDLEKIKQDNIKIQDRINKMSSLVNKINNLNIDEEDIAIINHFCKQFKINSVELIASIVIKSLEKPYGTINIEEVEVQTLAENETKLSEEELISFFNNYGCDFTKLSKDKKDRLINYGVLDNIKVIIETLKSYNIDLSTPYAGGTIFTEVFSINIFICSSADYVKKTLDTLKKYNMLSDETALIDSLKFAEIFLPRKVKYKEKTVAKGEGDQVFLSGAYEDFNYNLGYFYNVYKKLMLSRNSSVTEQELQDGFRENVYNKRARCFATPHDKIENTIRIFENYGIPANLYITKLSSFLTPNSASIFDKMIEVDCFYYIANNLTNMRRTDLITSLIFAKQKLGWDNQELFRTYKNNDVFRLSDDRPVVSLNKLNNSLENNGIYPRQMVPDSSYIMDDVKDIFEKLDEIVGIEFDANMKSFFNNYSYNRGVIEGKGFEYFDLMKQFLSQDNPLVINIDGVLVSLNKVLRIYSIYNNHSITDSKEKLLYALTYNSHYTKEQVETIYKRIYELSSGSNGKEQVK